MAMPEATAADLRLERLYQVGVISKDQNAVADGTQFLESFKVF